MIEYEVNNKIKGTKMSVNKVVKLIESILNERAVGWVETYVDGKQMLGSDGSYALHSLTNPAIQKAIASQTNKIISLLQIKSYLKNSNNVELMVKSDSGKVLKVVDITQQVTQK